LTACGGSSGSTTIITLGGILSQTGSLATIGQEELQAAQLAIDEINGAGGVLGNSLSLSNIDDGSDPMRAATSATTLVADKVPAILGAIASGSTIPAAGVTIPAGVVLMSGASTSPAISSLSDNDTVFRTCPSDSLQGSLLAKRAKAKGMASVAVVFIPGPYGQGLSQAFVQNFTQAGGQVPFNQMYSENQQSYMTLLQQVYASTPAPDAILLVAYPVDGAQIVKDYNSAFASKQTFWFFTDATEDPSFVSAVGGSNFTFQHEGTGSPTPNTPPYMAYQSAFLAKYGVAADPGTFSPNVYDATYLIALAMQAGGASDANTIKTNLRGVFDPGNTMVGPGQWATALTTLKSGGKVSYQASSGSVGFDANGDPQTAPYGIWKVSGGTISVVEASVSP
jgi:ABC-type branched-subunit amino acid transport system substrate-binding protein